MKKETIIVIISGALLAVAAMIGIKRYRDNKATEGGDNEEAETTETKEDNGSTTNKGGGSGGGTNTAPVGMSWNAACGRYYGTTAFAIKVRQVQKEIGITGCDVDGLVGNQTNNALKTKYPKTFSVYGNLTESNIEQYLDGKFEKSQAQKEGNATMMSNWVSNLVNKGSATSNRDDITVYIMNWDTAKQAFVPTGGSNTMMKDVRIPSDTYQSYVLGKDIGQFAGAHYAVFKLKASQLKNATGGDRFGAIYIGYLTV